MEDIRVRERKHPRISDRLRATLYPAGHSPDLSQHAEAGIRIGRPTRGLLDQQGPMQQLAFAFRDCKLGGPNRTAGILHAADRSGPREFGRSLIGSTYVGRVYRWADLSAEP